MAATNSHNSIKLFATTATAARRIAPRQNNSNLTLRCCLLQTVILFLFVFAALHVCATHAVPLYGAAAGEQQLANHMCAVGPPPQWSPHLDIFSKAHLAPIMAIGRLDKLSCFVDVSGNLITAATFSVQRLMKPANDFRLRNIENLTIYYKLSQSAASASIFAQQIEKIVSDESFAETQQNFNSIPRDASKLCPVEMDQRFLKRLPKMFRLNTEYILFLTVQSYNAAASLAAAASREQSMMMMMIPRISHHYVTRRSTGAEGRVANTTTTLSSKINTTGASAAAEAATSQPQHRNNSSDSSASKQKRAKRAQFYHQNVYSPNQASTGQTVAWLLQAYSTHEPFDNQTEKAYKHLFLCRNCGKEAKVQLASPHSIVAYKGGASKFVSFECKIFGYPTPWIHWFRNGQQLKQKPGRVSITSKRYKKRLDVYVSKLELQFNAKKNDSGNYECRAQNVVSREPSLGLFTLLELQAHLAPPSPAPITVLHTTSNSDNAAVDQRVPQANGSKIFDNNSNVFDASAAVAAAKAPAANTVAPHSAKPNSPLMHNLPSVGVYSENSFLINSNNYDINRNEKTKPLQVTTNDVTKTAINNNNNSNNINSFENNYTNSNNISQSLAQTTSNASTPPSTVTQQPPQHQKPSTSISGSSSSTLFVTQQPTRLQHTNTNEQHTTKRPQSQQNQQIINPNRKQQASTTINQSKTNDASSKTTNSLSNDSSELISPSTYSCPPHINKVYCLNDGICETQVVGEYSCRCSDGYRGLRCQYKYT